VFAIEFCDGLGNGTSRKEPEQTLVAIQAPRRSESRNWARPTIAARASRTHRGMRGFTLIELMITVVIVAILAAIALPSYLDYLRRSARAEAQTFLTDMASRQQQFLVDRRAYAVSVAALGMTPSGSLTGKFDFSVAAANGPPPTFTLTASGLGGQLKDHCPVLSIDNAGNRLPTDCW
jgi:type IV pilus assembly protein PilE